MLNKSISLPRLILIGMIAGVMIGAGLGAVIGAGSPAPEQYNSPAVSDQARERLKAANAPSPAFTKLTESVGGSPAVAGGIIGAASFGILGAGLAFLGWTLRHRRA